MICPTCGSDNPDGAAFCQQGHPLPITPVVEEEDGIPSDPEIEPTPEDEE